MCIAFAALACIELARALALKTEPEELSASFLYWAMRKLITDKATTDAPPNSETSGANFTFAVRALRKFGICGQVTWDNAEDTNVKPAPPAMKEAASRTVSYLNDAVHQPPGQPAQGGAQPALFMSQLGSNVLTDLRNDLPVGVAFPRYESDSGEWIWDSASDTDGTLDFNEHSTMIEAGGGHAVCIVGFEPDPLAAGGGWFIFRNSFGAGFPSKPLSTMPQSGYGRFAYADIGRVWDVFTLRKPTS